MRGAARRDALQMALIARATWAGAQLTSDGVTAFVAEVLGEDPTPPALPPEALSAMLARQSRGLSTITRAEALKRMH